MLSNLQLKQSYRSNRDNLVNDFYVPCLREASLYRRAVGYFTSSALSLAATGLRPFIEKRGRMCLVASPYFDSEDIEAIKRGYLSREEVVSRALLRGLSEKNDSVVVRDRLGFLAWLVSEGLLDIKIAVLERDDTVGIYHEKIGIFEDESNNQVAFTGSSNESAGGLLSNFESIQVFRSWVERDTERIAPLVADFEELWSDKTHFLKVYKFPDAVRKELLRLRPERLPDADPEQNAAHSIPEIIVPPNFGFPEIPKDIVIRDYQKKAVEKWFEAGGRGLLRMATGTGKTVTALALLTQLYRAVQREGRPLVCVVVCPFQHLVSQWAEQASKFGILPIKCMESKNLWVEELRESIMAVRDGHFPFVMAIATNSTFQGDLFRETVGKIQSDFLLIADEVHNMGALSSRESLPENAAFRLGLSATPERWFDDTGTQSLLNYFGKIVFELGLREAIAIGALSKYDYFPHIVELTTDELAQYLEITAQIGRVSGLESGASEGEPSDEKVKMLLIRRAQLVAVARNKLPRLAEAMRPLARTTHNLVYCGTGKVEMEDDLSVRQLDAVVQLLGNDLGMRVNSYTAETYLDERDELRKLFVDGTLQALVAIRCLDEGIDIPETRRAFILASSSNPKQFIQRRGRILRKAPGKKLAEIHDFLVIPPSEAFTSELFAIERKLLRKELLRVLEFAELADNGPKAMEVLLPLRMKYSLLDMG
jgi:DNA phosphorothioation system restriction enzyme